MIARLSDKLFLFTRGVGNANKVNLMFQVHETYKDAGAPAGSLSFIVDKGRWVLIWVQIYNRRLMYYVDDRSPNYTGGVTPVVKDYPNYTGNFIFMN
jgi:hypothetical protein